MVANLTHMQEADLFCLSSFFIIWGDLSLVHNLCQLIGRNSSIVLRQWLSNISKEVEFFGPIKL